MGPEEPTTVAAPKRRDHLPIWTLIGAIALLSTGMWLGIVRTLDTVDDSLSPPWWLVAIAFAVVETFVVNLHFRSESGSFSLLEIPLIVGLLFVDPTMLWVAIILGSGISLALIRRQPLVKVAFNVANLSLHVAVATIVYAWLLGNQDPLSPLGWLALFATALLSSLVEVLGINLVIGIAEQKFAVRRAWNMLVFGWIVAGANTIQALIAVLLVVVEPLASLLLIGSTAMLFIAYRAYVSEREHRERVEFLHQSTRSLRETSETDSAVAVLLEEATSMFRAGSAELVLFPAPESGDEPLVYSTRDGRTRQRKLPEADLDELSSLVEQSAIPFRVGEDTIGRGTAVEQLARLGINDAMIGTLTSDQRVIGLLIVGDRLGSVTTFTDEDLHLFENLIEQAAVALENDQLEQALSRLRVLESELSHQARFDVLTGLANRNLFTSRLEEEVEREPGAIALLYVDLDDFKLVNDRLGHAAGDALLVEVARRLEDVIRPTDLAARLGGDEFSIMLASEGDAEAVAHRVIGTLSAPFLLGADEARIGASVGIAASDGQCSAAEVLHRADLAMYAAKQRGKGSVVWYSADLQSDQSRQQALNSALRKAISEEQFDVVYQPIVRVSDLGVVGAEALVRWRHGASQPLTPAKFMAEAERSGLVIAIDRIVRRRVLETLPTVLETAPDGFFCSVNISARNLHQSAFIGDVAADVLSAGVDASSFVLEVTESAFAGDPAIASQALQEIRDLGVRIALDDFGTGYSSLSYLRELPIDFLKIAQAFVSDLVTDADSSFVDVITGLGRSMGLTIIAEGVEQGAQWRALQRMGCDLAQGFMFSVPMPLEELMGTLADPARLSRAVSPPAAA